MSTSKRAIHADTKIPDGLKSEAAHVAFCITSALGEIRQRALMIGGLLLQMKERLPRGTYSEWVRSACGLQVRTAENYVLAWSVTQCCPSLDAAKSFKLGALYELGRLADTEVRKATLREVVAALPAAGPADVLTEFKSRIGLLPATIAVALPAAIPPAPSVTHPIERSLVAGIAASLGDKLSDFVTLVEEYGAIAVCDALLEVHRRSVQNENFSFPLATGVQVVFAGPVETGRVAEAETSAIAESTMRFQR